MNISKVDGLLAEMRAAMAAAQGVAAAAPAPSGGKVDFGDALKTALDGVNNAQDNATKLQNAFVLGDDKVSLSDAMIAMQKANIAFQTTIQVRNKVITAYNDIMNMQV